MIDGIEIKELTVFADERGRVMEILRSDEPALKKFGQSYMSTTYPGAVKGWHYHDKQWDHICCVYGMIKLAVYDEREGSKTKGEINEFHLGVHKARVVVLPPGVWHGWKATSLEEAIVINTVSEPFNKTKPDEHRIDPHKNHIPYSWERKDG